MARATARSTRGPAMLRSVAKDLRYEWDMARRTAHLHAEATALEHDVLASALLEDFLLHARNLRDFFSSSGRADDVIALDFLGVTPRVAMPLLRSAPVRMRLNKAISHLSYSRPRLRAGWNVKRLLAEIDSAMIIFVARLRLVHPRLAVHVFGAA